MDLAPLTKAQDAARSATTHEAHESAAGQFSAAADGIQDVEALRILALLESHHRQLARIINIQHASQTTSTPSGATPVDLLTDSPSTNARASNADSDAAPITARPRATSPRLQRRAPPMEVSSTIATDLATARGIPAHQQRRSRHTATVSSQNRDMSSADAPRGKPEQEILDQDASNYRQSSGKSSSEHESDTASTGRPKPHTGEMQSTAKAEGFQKFYSTFEGLLSKLSAPLAFAGLPLNPDETAQESNKLPTNTFRPSRPAQPPGDMPDVTRIFSKAALRAVKEDYPGLGNMQESFMVVPSTGGTRSYASILAKHEPHEGEASASDQQAISAAAGVERLVDGAETPRGTLSKTRDSRSKLGPSSTNKSAEELEAENKSLKQIIDNLSRRLYMWEKSAQTQSMALQQSFRTLQPPPQTPAETVSGQDVDSRLKELESQLSLAKKEAQKYEKENEKLKSVVMRYRERWEKLKEGARVRREGVEKGGAESPAV